MRRQVLVLLIGLGCAGAGGRLAAAEPSSRSAAEYARDLESSDRAVRREAAYQLSRMGTEARVALPQLVKALGDDQQQVWFGAISALANLGPNAEPALPALIGELEAWQPFRKDRQGSQALYRTALALGSIGAPAVPALSNLLSAQAWFVRAGAARACGFAGAASRPLVPALVRLLADDRVEVREAASEALAGHGAAAVPGLMAMLQGEREPRVRATVVTTLGGLGTNAVTAVSVLAQAAKEDSDPAVRVECLAALARCGMEPEARVTLLLGAARDGSQVVREGAFGQLLTVRPVEGLLMPRLLTSLRSTDGAERDWAARLVTELGVEASGAAETLVELLRTGSAGGGEPNPVFTRALAALGDRAVRLVFADLMAGGGSGGEGTPGTVGGAGDWRRAVLRQASALAIPALSEGLTHGRAEVRAGALEGLAALARNARSVARRLPPLLEDVDPAVRGWAWTAAAACGVPAERLLERLEPGLKDPSSEVRRAVLGAVAELGAAAKSAVPLLIREMGAEDELVGRAALRALGALGPDAAEAVGALSQALGGATRAERRIAILETLGAMGSEAATALDPMIPLLQAGEPGVRRAAAHAVGRLRAAGKPALGGLRALVTDADEQVRAAAMLALVAVDPESEDGLRAVQQGLEDASVEVRRSALAALTAMGERGRAAEVRLFAMLESGGEADAVKEALRAIHPTSVPALRGILAHADWTVRELAVDALSRLGSSAEEAVPALEKMVRDDAREEVKRAARRAVRRIRER